MAMNPNTQPGRPTTRHTISALVENRPGVLARIAGLFSRRGFNIESLTVSETQDPGLSRMTIVVSADDIVIEQVEKQLNKLIDVVKVSDITTKQTVDRELVFIKVKADAGTRGEIMQIASIFRAQIIDLSENSLIIEMTGDADKTSAFIDLMRRFGIIEVLRTGKVSLIRGPQAT
ncbi:MAG: acetolactate synthase small subunit [bacterium]